MSHEYRRASPTGRLRSACLLRQLLPRAGNLNAAVAHGYRCGVQRFRGCGMAKRAHAKMGDGAQGGFRGAGAPVRFNCCGTGCRCGNAEMSQSTLGRLDSRTTAPLAEIQPHRTRVTARAADQEQLAFLFASSSPNHDTGPLSGPQSTPVRATNSSAAVVGCTLRVEATVPSLPPIAQAVLLQFPELEAPTLSIFSITYSTEKGRRHAKR